MFGLKIRTWMETHIVRPKKSKSKGSKQQQSSNHVAMGDKRPTTVLLSTEPSGLINSPRRSEISPLQNQNYSRAGWQTPDSPPKYTKSTSPVKKFHKKRADEDIPTMPTTTVIITNDIKSYTLQARVADNTWKPMEQHPRTRMSNGSGRYNNTNNNINNNEAHTIICSTKDVNNNNHHNSHNSSSGVSEFGGVINYLSSPESAYSTGYSTDCTSPGGISFGPEYYINMRNGIHYIPPPNLFKVSRQLDNCHNGKLLTANHATTASGKCSPQLSSPLLKRNDLLQNGRVESPSPRQRCRIRTNPWLSTSNSSPNPSNSKSPVPIGSPAKTVHLCYDVARKPTVFDAIPPQNEGYSSTSPNSIRKRKLVDNSTCSKLLSIESFDDDTLKEIMGKFDESYTYDKETDILSDSDGTQCQSDYEDTGQEAEDEDEDDIDFIDTGASLSESTAMRNLGSCEYYSGQDATRSNRSLAKDRRKKMVRRTRKKSLDRNITVNGSGLSILQRECRSAGGTPLLNRRKLDKKQHNDLEYWNRSNSMVFDTMPRSPALIKIAESEKQLLKADLEAFIKYKKLINEAENILDTMKSIHSQKLPPVIAQGQLPVGPPPALDPPQVHPKSFMPTNKRVEMLRNELPKRSAELAPNNMKPAPLKPRNCVINLPPPSPPPRQPVVVGGHPLHLINKKIELLKQEQALFGSQQNRNNGGTRPQCNGGPMVTTDLYPCPQSEPLKRKVYSPPKPLLVLAKENEKLHFQQDLQLRNNCRIMKQKLILKTLEDLKRNLEDQKTELCGLNDNV